MQRFLLLLFASALAGCIAPPGRPPYGVRTAEGLVHGGAEGVTDDVARRAERVSVQVRAELGVDRADPWELWLLDGDEPWRGEGGGDGHLAEWTWTFGPLRGRHEILCLWGEPVWSSTHVLAHEITHWHTRSWRVPHVLLEGFADWVALRLTDEEAAVRADHRRIVLALLRDGHSLVAELAPLELTGNEWQLLDEPERLLVYAYGVVVVDQLGVDGVRGLSGAPPEVVRAAVERALHRATQATASRSDPGHGS